MTAFTPEQQRYIDDAIEARFNDSYGSLFSVGQPPTTALATPTGFGLVEIESTEAAPVAFNASSFLRGTFTPDVSNATQVLASTGIPIPVVAGRTYRFYYSLWMGSAAGSVGGVIFQFSGGIGKLTSVIKAPLGAGTWNMFPKRGAQLSTQNVCNFDMSAVDGYVEIIANVQANATGNIDLLFACNSAANTLIVRDYSFVNILRN